MKKIPLRKCIVTGEQLPKKDLIRIVKTTEGNVELDPSGKVNGRGAYIKRDLDTVLEAKSKGLLNRSLKMKVPNEVYEALIQYVQ